MNNADRRYVVLLTNGETLRPDIVKTKDSGWLYCCWTGDAPGGTQRTFAPHAVQYYDSLPAEGSE